MPYHNGNAAPPFQHLGRRGSLKRFLEAQGIMAGSPRETLAEAYAQGWIADEQMWLGMTAGS